MIDDDLLYDLAQELPPPQRAALARWMRDNLAVVPVPPEVTAWWADQLDRRHREVLEHPDQGVAWDEVWSGLAFGAPSRPLSKPVRFTTEARAELEATVQLFEGGFPPLRKVFGRDVDGVICRISEAVPRYERAPGQPRRWDKIGLHWFPQSFACADLPDQLVVFAFGDRERAPDYWHGGAEGATAPERQLAMATPAVAPSLRYQLIGRLNLTLERPPET